MTSSDRCGRCGGPLADDGHYFMGEDMVKECDSCVDPLFLAARMARLERESRQVRRQRERDVRKGVRGRTPFIRPRGQ